MSECPPWLEKILKFTSLDWLKMAKIGLYGKKDRSVLAKKSLNYPYFGQKLPKVDKNGQNSAQIRKNGLYGKKRMKFDREMENGH